MDKKAQVGDRHKKLVQRRGSGLLATSHVPLASSLLRIESLSTKTTKAHCSMIRIARERDQ